MRDYIKVYYLLMLSKDKQAHNIFKNMHSDDKLDYVWAAHRIIKQKRCKGTFVAVGNQE